MTTRSERIEDRMRSMAAQHRCGCGHPACNRCDDDRENEAALATESAPTEPTGAYASLLRVAQKYVAFCGQAGVEANASSLDPTEQLHAQALAAIQRAKVAALPPSEEPLREVPACNVCNVCHKRVKALFLKCCVVCAREVGIDNAMGNAEIVRPSPTPVAADDAPARCTKCNFTRAHAAHRDPGHPRGHRFVAPSGSSGEGES